MDAVKYLETRRRMVENLMITKYYDTRINGFSETYQPEKAVDAMEKWSSEHPVETYKSHFLKAFPNADTTKLYRMWICREYIFGGVHRCEQCKISCTDCWNEPYEESK